MNLVNLYSNGIQLIVFSVDDVNKEFERLKKLGVIFKKRPEKTEFGIDALFEDTCGNYIQLHQV